MKVCPKCNTQVESDHLFCMECGYRFETAPEPQPVSQELPEEPVEETPEKDITDVENHITWNVQPGQVARLIREKEFVQYSDVAGIIIGEGTRMLVRRNADEYTMLSSGIYSFPERKAAKNDSQGFVRNIFSSANVKPQDDNLPLELLSILLVRDGDIPVLFGMQDVPAKNLTLEVGLSATVRVSSMQELLSKIMIDRDQLSAAELTGILAPKVENLLRDVLADVYVSEDGLPAVVRAEITEHLTALNSSLGGVAFSGVDDVRIGHEALERFRALNSELYLTGRELEFLERTNEFKNRLAAAQNAQQIEDAKNDLALMRALQQINQDKILAEDELEKFYMLLSREKKIREAQNEEQIAAALADIEKTGLVRAEDLNRLKDEIRTNEHKRGHAFRMMQKKDELELASLQREYDKRVRDEDYEFEKRKKDDDFGRFQELERMRSEKEAAEHDRNMEALREMQRAKLEKLRMSKELTPEQILAISAENLDAEAVARLAESLGKSREAEYLERLTQARIEDMKDVIRAYAPNAGAQQPQAQPQQAVRYCPSCGNRNDAQAKFCMSCGTKMF